MPAGRPSDYNQEIAIRICERIADGESLRKICLDEDMPSRSMVFRWIGAHEEFRDQYTRARMEQAQTFVDEIIDISDDGANDWMQHNDPENPGYRVNGEHLSRSKLRVDTRKWVASKVLPKVYGDKLAATLTGADDGPIKVEMSDTELSRWIAFQLRKGLEE